MNYRHCNWISRCVISFVMRGSFAFFFSLVYFAFFSLFFLIVFERFKKTLEQHVHNKSIYLCLPHLHRFSLDRWREKDICLRSKVEKKRNSPALDKWILLFPTNFAILWCVSVCVKHYFCLFICLFRLQTSQTLLHVRIDTKL